MGRNRKGWCPRAPTSHCFGPRCLDTRENAQPAPISCPPHGFCGFPYRAPPVIASEFARSRWRPLPLDLRSCRHTINRNTQRAGACAVNLEDANRSKEQPPAQVGLESPAHHRRKGAQLERMATNEMPPPSGLGPAGAKLGVGVRHALFPGLALGAAWAASFPTPFSTASGVVGLIAGPSSDLRRLDFE
jgi:hypothetical protein